MDCYSVSVEILNSPVPFQIHTSYDRLLSMRHIRPDISAFLSERTEVIYQ